MTNLSREKVDHWDGIWIHQNKKCAISWEDFNKWNGKLYKHDALCIDDSFGTKLSLFIPEMKNNCYNENISLIWKFITLMNVSHCDKMKTSHWSKNSLLRWTDISSSLWWKFIQVAQIHYIDERLYFSGKH